MTECPGSTHTRGSLKVRKSRVVAYSMRLYVSPVWPGSSAAYSFEAQNTT
jgi:hypothetical protein